MSSKTLSRKERTKPTGLLGRFWHFLWYEDSIASWFVSIVLSALLIKFVIYPVMGLMLGTQFPIVAVVSNSMEHDLGFNDWWASQEDLYLEFNITKNNFTEYPMRNGFNKGDIIVLVGAKPERLRIGQIIVYWGGREYPIIHRVVAIGKETDGTPYFQTKGDHNRGQIQNPPTLDERHVPSSDLIGRAVLRIPYLGWVKIGFVNLLRLIGINAS
jgi:signal peptidase I